MIWKSDFDCVGVVLVVGLWLEVEFCSGGESGEKGFGRRMEVRANEGGEEGILRHFLRSIKEGQAIVILELASLLE